MDITKRFFKAPVLPATFFAAALLGGCDSGNFGALSKTRDTADALVVFTGSPGRIEAALENLQPGQKLLITGYDAPLTYIWDIAQEYNIDESRIFTGRKAADTLGNALEAAEWLNKNPDINHIVLVTSGFHMPRSLLLMSVFKPDRVSLSFLAIRGNKNNRDEWPKEGMKTLCVLYPGCTAAFYIISGRRPLLEQPAQEDSPERLTAERAAKNANALPESARILPHPEP